MGAPVGVIASSKINAAAVLPTSGQLWWFDADAAATITSSGGLVSQWNDKSSVGANATSAGTPRPTLTTGGLKAGRGSIVFAGSHRMDITNGATNQKPFTVVACLKHTNVAAYRAIIGTPNSGGLEWRLSNAHKQSVVKNQVVEIGAAAVVVTANVVVVLIITYSATGQLVVYMDGVSQLSVTNDQAFNASVPLAYMGDSVGEPLTATVGELVKYNRVVTTQELADINSYLNAKWK